MQHPPPTLNHAPKQKQTTRLSPSYDGSNFSLIKAVKKSQNAMEVLDLRTLKKLVLQVMPPRQPQSLNELLQRTLLPSFLGLKIIFPTFQSAQQSFRGLKRKKKVKKNGTQPDPNPASWGLSLIFKSLTQYLLCSFLYHCK